jgi:hypothetical protein
LTKEELGTVVSAGAAHIQKQFEWESVKNTEIDLCNDPAALILIDIGDQDAEISQPPENN